jgi:hypothetical protein
MDDLDRKHLGFRRGQVVDVQVVRNALLAPPAATGHTESGYLVELPQGSKHVGQSVRARLGKIGRSLAEAEVLGRGSGGPSGLPTPPIERDHRPERPERGPRGGGGGAGPKPETPAKPDAAESGSGGGGKQPARRPARRGGRERPREGQPA